MPGWWTVHRRGKMSALCPWKQGKGVEVSQWRRRFWFTKRTALWVHILIICYQRCWFYRSKRSGPWSMHALVWSWLLEPLALVHCWGCNFFVQWGEALTSDLLHCFKTPQQHCASSMNFSTCPCCREQQWDKWQVFYFFIRHVKEQRWGGR